jgi:peptide-methionine (R)-S-oxide reductase
MSTALPILAVFALALMFGCERAVSADNTGKAAAPAAAKSPTTAPAQAAITPISHTEEEWKKILTPVQFHVLREKGTERAFTGEYDHHFEKGAYACAACGLELFESDTKFNSGCGWPAFYAAKAGDRVKLTHDTSFGMDRTEVTCARCGGHLGHIFNDAPSTPTGQRYCINSVSIKFIPAADRKHPTTAPTAEKK